MESNLSNNDSSIGYATRSRSGVLRNAVAWYLVGASLCFASGVVSFAIPVWQRGLIRSSHLDGFADFMIAISRRADRAFLYWWLASAIAIGMVRGFPLGACGPLMIVPCVVALCLDIMRGIERHNLLPFELLQFLGLAMIGTVCSVIGRLVRAAIDRLFALSSRKT